MASHRARLLAEVKRRARTKDPAANLEAFFANSRRFPLPEMNPQYVLPGHPSIYYRANDDGEVVRELHLQAEFWGKVEQEIGDLQISSFERLQRRFARARDCLEDMLVAEGREEREKIPVHQTFPFCMDFSASVADLFERAFNYEFEQIPFSRGGQGAIFRSRDGAHVLKLFHRKDQDDLYKFHVIARNLGDLSFFEQDPFVPVRLVSELGMGTLAYVADYFPGEGVSELLRRSPDDRELQYRLLSAYARMLNTVHAVGKVVVDNNVGCFLYNDDEVRICDVDFITSLDSPFVMRRTYPIYTPSAPSTEQNRGLPYTQVGDLEAFAHMIHTVVFGDFESTLCGETSGAFLGHQMYTPEYMRALGPNLWDLMGAVLSRPRDNSLKATDFISAIDLTYGR